MDVKYQDICREVQKVAQRAAEFIALQRESFQPQSVEHKGEQNLVSYVDKEAESIIIAALTELLPEASVLAEESSTETRTSNPDGQLLWVIDPLDGTTNFVHDMPPYCVSIALMEGNEVVVGVIYEITRRECFWAFKGSRCYLNEREICVSQIDQIKDSLVITGVSYGSRGGKGDFFSAFNYFNERSNGTRRIGSAAANLAYVAAGRAEAFFQRGLAAWDVAAGAFLVERAGGKVVDYSGGSNFVFGEEIIATNSDSHNNFFRVICDRF